MAASLLRLSRRVCFKSSCAQKRHAYIVLLPEIPTDTPATNPLLRQGPFPRLSELTPEKCANAVGKAVLDFESGLVRIEEALQEPGCKKDFDSLIIPIEKHLAPLIYVWSTVKCIVAVNHTSDMINVFNKLHNRVLSAQLQRFKSLPFYHALKEVRTDENELTEAQERVVSKYLLEAKLGGVELNDYNAGHLLVTQRTIVKEKEIFRIKVNESIKRFRHRISDYSMVREFPEDLLKRMAFDRFHPTVGPWTVTLDPEIYDTFMQHCSDRDIRWNAWQAYNSRGSSSYDSELYTSLQIEEIRFQRRDQARLLGYTSYVHLSMETKMAGSVENLMSMISSLKQKSQPVMEEELAELENFARDWGFDGNLEIWDVPFWRHKQCQSLFELKAEQLKSYLPFTHVLKSLFDLCHNLFGVSFKDATAQVEVWDEHVKFYKIFNESGDQMASFYLDPYFREEKITSRAFLDLGIGRCDSLGIKPSAFLVFNFSQPTDVKPSLLTISDVTVLFQNFGNLLQHSLTTVGNVDVSGMTNVAWDAVDVCSHFMSFWLTDVNTLRKISNHYKSGEKFDEKTCVKIVNAKKHFASYDLIKELYLCEFDLAMYSSKDYWIDVMKRLWPMYMPFPLKKDDMHPCGFSKIFYEDFAAAYFSFMWSEMIAADVFSAFQEVGLHNTNEIKATGKRFRDTYLALGGGCHPSEIFRQFRGRDPSPDALLKLKGIDN